MCTLSGLFRLGKRTILKPTPCGGRPGQPFGVLCMAVKLSETSRTPWKSLQKLIHLPAAFSVMRRSNRNYRRRLISNFVDHEHCSGEVPWCVLLLQKAEPGSAPAESMLESKWRQRNLYIFPTAFWHSAKHRWNCRECPHGHAKILKKKAAGGILGCLSLAFQVCMYTQDAILEERIACWQFIHLFFLSGISCQNVSRENNSLNCTI